MIRSHAGAGRRGGGVGERVCEHRDYLVVEQVIDRITSTPRHVVVDAQLAGACRGLNASRQHGDACAASLFISLSQEDLESAIGVMFAGKGEKVIESGRRALRLGRGAARAYMSGLDAAGRRGSSGTGLIR